MDELETTIATAMGAFSPEDARSFFAHCGYNNKSA